MSAAGDVVVEVAENLIVSRATIELVALIPATQSVMTRFTPDRVAAIVSSERVVSVSTDKEIVPYAAAEKVAQRAPGDHVVAAAGPDDDSKCRSRKMRKGRTGDSRKIDDIATRTAVDFQPRHVGSQDGLRLGNDRLSVDSHKRGAPSRPHANDVTAVRSDHQRARRRIERRCHCQ